MTEFESIILDKKQLLIIWNDRFQTHTLDEMLELIKSEYVNPDEAFVIAYMIGVSAEKVRRNNAEIQHQLNNMGYVE